MHTLLNFTQFGLTPELGRAAGESRLSEHPHERRCVGVGDQGAERPDSGCEASSNCQLLGCPKSARQDLRQRMHVADSTYTPAPSLERCTVEPAQAGGEVFSPFGQEPILKVAPSLSGIEPFIQRGRFGLGGEGLQI